MKMINVYTFCSCVHVHFVYVHVCTCTCMYMENQVLSELAQRKQHTAQHMYMYSHTK